MGVRAGGVFRGSGGSDGRAAGVEPVGAIGAVGGGLIYTKCDTIGKIATMGRVADNRDYWNVLSYLCKIP